MEEKPLGADAAAVASAHAARVLAEFDRQFGTDGPERNSDSVGRRAGCDDCAVSIELRAEHRSFVERVVKEIHLRGQIAVWQSIADFLISDPRVNFGSATRATDAERAAAARRSAAQK
jgi:hypothetical protein